MNAEEKSPVLVGIRHHSPAGAYYIRELLREKRPDCLLIEAPADFSELIHALTDPALKPPFAVMAYTVEAPVRSVLYPFAVYSPEFQAMLAAKELGIELVFCDLPSPYMIGLQLAEEKYYERQSEEEREAAQKEASALGDTESFWERYLEQSENLSTYLERSRIFGEGAREVAPGERIEQAWNGLREAYMRRIIAEKRAAGIAAEKIVVLTGAFHSAALYEGECLDDAALKALPQYEVKKTLMPYSYQRLSRRAGYSAGNKVPAYYELLWDALRKEQPESHAARYLSTLAGHIRERGGMVSSAEVLEANLLAQSLASLREGRYPTHDELQDAAVTCMGHGSFGEIAEGLALTDIGTKIGEVPRSGLLTSIQRDFADQCADLKLNFGPVAEKLRLDLRENRRAKSEKSAFLQLRRSFFLQRLRLLGIGFAALQGSRQQDASWEENWVLSRTPEAEMQLAEAVLKGDTIAHAVSFDLQEKLTATEQIAEITELLESAFLCGMPELLQAAVSRLDSASIDEISIEEIARTAKILSRMLQFGDVRQSDVSVLRPILERLLLRAGLTLTDACFCDDEAAGHLAKSIEDIQSIFSVEKGLPSEKWEDAVRELSRRDDLNAKLSGLATAIRLDNGDLSEEELSREISRRMSIGLRAELGALWFEGLSLRNHYALIVRRVVWESLSRYLDLIPEESWKRAMVFLRRSFALYSASEKDMVAENLGEIWGLQKEQLSEVLNAELSKEESQALTSFDFDDF